MLACLLKKMKDEIKNDTNANTKADQEHMQEMLAMMITNRKADKEHMHGMLDRMDANKKDD
jgi:hypothetical protein